MTSHQTYDRAGVDPTGQESSQRHIRYQTQSNCFVEQLAQSVPSLFTRKRRIGTEVKVPIFFNRDAILREGQMMTGRQFVNVFENTLRVRHVAKREVGIEGHHIDPALDFRMDQQRLEL